MRDSNTRSAVACLVCGGTDAVRLPDPSTHSMASDWRVLDVPLGKLTCRACGLAYRDPALPHPADFADGYRLYAHPPGNAAELRRQSDYAAWIAATVPEPSRVLDVGCGNGSLLLALRECWPRAEIAGCDPSPESVAFATAAGLRAWVGTATDLPDQCHADVVVTVNVIEHTHDPRAFVAALRQALTPNGRLVLICPDGGRPNVELLVADHLFSFSGEHLVALCASEGLGVERWSRAPARLGSFQMVVAAKRDARGIEVQTPGPLTLLAIRQAYLASWRGLDAALAQRLSANVVCFGAGEAAGLLRAYAPDTWSRVRLCTTDDVSPGAFGNLRRVPLQDVSPEATVLVAVRPQDQPEVAGRLRATFRNVVTWYDLVPTDHAG